MKKILLATALLVLGASAHAETYHVDGVTIHVSDGCRSSSCVSVYAPGYGYYHEGHQAKVRRAQKEQKDTSRVASVTKKEDAAPAAVAATPVVEAKPAAAPAATPEAAAPAKPLDDAAIK